jgi:hypothetical protein
MTRGWHRTDRGETSRRSGPNIAKLSEGSISAVTHDQVAAHLPWHLVQHVRGCPPDLGTTRATLVADRGPICSMVCLPRCQRQRAPWTVGAEGAGDHPLQEHGDRRWCGLGRHHRHPHGDCERGSPERPDDDHVRQGLPAPGGPPRQDTRADRPEDMEHHVEEAKCSPASYVPFACPRGAPAIPAAARLRPQHRRPPRRRPRRRAAAAGHRAP